MRPMGSGIGYAPIIGSVQVATAEAYVVSSIGSAIFLVFLPTSIAPSYGFKAKDT